jgi:hypothetical protein
MIMQILSKELPRSKDILTLYACQAYMESDAIEADLRVYRGNDKPKIIRRWLNLLAIYHETIQ